MAKSAPPKWPVFTDEEAGPEEDASSSDSDSFDDTANGNGRTPARRAGKSMILGLDFGPDLTRVACGLPIPSECVAMASYLSGE